MKGASGKKGRLKQKCFLYKILCTRGSKVRKLSVEIQKKKKLRVSRFGASVGEEKC